ncbi:hybrid sensor histidine kinase/response regulator [Comamonas composti]|uniref:hybrid sensor histidine kinase/response regulator n=1 Tax=Comamonas composti TaxID=408558 RepID=UPI00040F39F0|nr:ATP-binding protein [Comamonas composti]
MLKNVGSHHAPAQQQAPRQTLRILHIEDSAADLALARLSLQRSGLDCEIVSVDRLEAIGAALDAQHFDLILADYHLPGFTALDVWALVRDRAGHPPFVLLTGAIGETAAVSVMREGISDYLLKDHITRLPHVVTHALEVHEARRARQRALAELQVSERRLAELTAHLQSSIEGERTRIAREIHDDIGGSLTSVKFDLAWIARNTPEGALHQHALAALEMLEQALGASQRIMLDLRPPVLDQGLVAAVQWLARDFEARTGISTHLQASADTMDMAGNIQVVAYRVAQEALMNVIKHAKASCVRIDLSDQEGFLTLEVNDNGQGLAPDARDKPESFGLRGLDERVRAIQGWLDVSSQPGKGTSVIASIPLPHVHTCPNIWL